MPNTKNVIKIDCVYSFHLNCRFTFSMKLPRHFVPRNDSISGLSIVRWDISLTLNMTYFLSPIGALRHFPRRRKQITVFASVAKQTPERVEVYGVYSPYFFGGIFRLRSIWRTWFGGIAAALRASQWQRVGRWFGEIFRCAQYDVLGLGDCRGTSCLVKTMHAR